jgi:hypothetical protein
MSAPRDDTPLRLKEAAAIAFPNGGVSEASLRREAAKGRLVIERIAGKDFVTLAAIAEMREKCRRGPKARGYISDQPNETNPAPCESPRDGSSETETARLALDAARATAQRLRAGLPNTSRPNTRLRGESAR